MIISYVDIDNKNNDDDDEKVASMYACVHRYKYVCVPYQFLSPY